AKHSSPEATSTFPRLRCPESRSTFSRTLPLTRLGTPTRGPMGHRKACGCLHAGAVVIDEASSEGMTGPPAEIRFSLLAAVAYTRPGVAADRMPIFPDWTLDRCAPSCVTA